MKYTTIFSQCCNIAGMYEYICTVYYCASRFTEQKCCGRYKWWCQAFSLAPAHTRTAGRAYETTGDVYWCCGIVKESYSSSRGTESIEAWAGKENLYGFQLPLRKELTGILWRAFTLPKCGGNHCKLIMYCQHLAYYLCQTTCLQRAIKEALPRNKEALPRKKIHVLEACLKETNTLLSAFSTEERRRVLSILNYENWTS